MINTPTPVTDGIIAGFKMFTGETQKKTEQANVQKKSVQKDDKDKGR